MTKDQILDKLNQINDPELGVGIVDLGLIYKVQTTPEKIHVQMTFTSGSCPVGPQLVQQVKDALEGAAGVVDVEVVFDPPWSQDRIKPEVAALLNVTAESAATLDPDHEDFSDDFITPAR